MRKLFVVSMVIVSMLLLGSAYSFAQEEDKGITLVWDTNDTGTLPTRYRLYQIYQSNCGSYPKQEEFSFSDMSLFPTFVVDPDTEMTMVPDLTGVTNWLVPHDGSVDTTTKRLDKTDDNMADGLYRWAVTAETDEDYSSGYSEGVGACLDFTPTSPPANFAYTLNNRAVSFTWQAPPESDVAGYRLYSSAADFTAFTPDQFSHSISELSLGSHTYFMTAIDEVGNESDKTTNIVITIGSPDDPGNVNIIIHTVNATINVN